MSAKSNLVARRYADSLLDMASDAGALEAVEKDFGDLAAMLSDVADLRRLFHNPLISRAQQEQALRAIGDQAKFNPLTARFLGVLSQNRRLGIVESIITAFQDALAARRGQVKAKVETAFALSPAQTRDLQERLSKAMGSHVTMEVAVNKDLLGGLVVTVGSKQIDDSVQRKLERLRRVMNAESFGVEQMRGRA